MDGRELEQRAKRGRGSSGDALASGMHGFRSGACGYKQGLTHFRTSVGSRAKGQSAGAKYDYITREGKYRKDREQADHRESGNLPEWAKQNPRAYWDAADKYERENGRLFVNSEFALPRELSREHQIALARETAQAMARTKDGQPLPYSFAIHDAKGTNPHMHLIISERGLDGIKRTAETWFKKAPTGARKTTDLQHREWVKETRVAWCERANNYLEAAGAESRLDHRSFKEQGLDRIPTVHVGYTDPKRPHIRQQRQEQNEGINLANSAPEVRKDLAQAEQRLAKVNEVLRQIEARAAAEKAAALAQEQPQQPETPHQVQDRARPEAPQAKPVEIHAPKPPSIGPEWREGLDKLEYSVLVQGFEEWRAIAAKPVPTLESVLAKHPDVQKAQAAFDAVKYLREETERTLGMNQMAREDYLRLEKAVREAAKEVWPWSSSEKKSALAVDRELLKEHKVHQGQVLKAIKRHSEELGPLQKAEAEANTALEAVRVRELAPGSATQKLYGQELAEHQQITGKAIWDVQALTPYVAERKQRFEQQQKALAEEKARKLAFKTPRRSKGRG